MSKKILEIKQAAGFLGTAITAGEQATEFTPAGAVAWISQNVGCAIGEDEACTGMIGERQIAFTLGHMGAHHARNAVAIAETEACQVEPCRLRQQFLGMGSTRQEREVRGDSELNVTAHDGTL